MLNCIRIIMLYFVVSNQQYYVLNVLFNWCVCSPTDDKPMLSKHYTI